MQGNVTNVSDIASLSLSIYLSLSLSYVCTQGTDTMCLTSPGMPLVRGSFPQSLTVIYLLYWYLLTGTDGSHFTCFTGTKVQILRQTCGHAGEDNMQFWQPRL